MPLTVAAGIDMPALAVGEALGEPLPDGPLPFEEIAMVRYFEERFFRFDEIADAAGAQAARIDSPEPAPRRTCTSTRRSPTASDTIEDNIAEAEALGLDRADLRRPRPGETPTGCRSTSRRCARLRRDDAARRCAAAIEAKLLDTEGALDLPAGIDGVDAIYAADHQVPLADGPTHPREVRERDRGGDLDADRRARRDRRPRRRGRWTARSTS